MKSVPSAPPTPVVNSTKKYKVSFAPLPKKIYSETSRKSSPPPTPLMPLFWKKIKNAFYQTNRTLDKWSYFIFCI